MTTFQDRERGFEAINASEQSAALRHLIHDAGMEIAGELTHQNGANAISVAQIVLAQRKAGKGLYELDFTALGATPEQLERIAQHQATRKALEAAFMAETPALTAVRGIEPKGHQEHAVTRTDQIRGH